MPYSNTFLAGLLILICTTACVAEELANPVVEIEEDVYRYEPADNGAGPMWCFGSTCLVRSGKQLFASGLETLPNVKPLNNCRWLLFQQTADGWTEVNRDPTGRTREPCPLATFEDGRVFLSANPTLVTDTQAYAGPARPEILQIDPRHPERQPIVLSPLWQGTPEFTEHSYRSFAADGKSGELILLQNIGYTHAEWAFLDRTGNWASQGQLVWPFGEEYDKPQPIRICYLNVALQDRAVYVCGVSDIVEPYDEWREYKRQLTGREWDYDFRRLFFAWCPDITTGKFEAWVEIASRDETCGWISPGDLWVDPQQNVHLVWTERALDERLRPKFFPDAKQSYSLNYAVVRHGELQHRDVLAEGGEQVGGLQPGQGRFHITPDGSLHVFYFVQGQDEGGDSVAENRVTRRQDDGGWSSHQTVALSRPFVQFFTATPRGGSPPNSALDLLGVRSGVSQTISYARVRFENADGERVEAP
jgi:hypothetical protein